MLHSLLKFSTVHFFEKLEDNTQYLIRASTEKDVKTNLLLNGDGF